MKQRGNKLRDSIVPVVAVSLPGAAGLCLLVGLLVWVLARSPRYAARVGGGHEVQQDQASRGGHDHQRPAHDVQSCRPREPRIPYDLSQSTPLSESSRQTGGRVFRLSVAYHICKCCLIGTWLLHDEQFVCRTTRWTVSAISLRERVRAMCSQGWTRAPTLKKNMAIRPSTIAQMTGHSWVWVRNDSQPFLPKRADHQVVLLAESLRLLSLQWHIENTFASADANGKRQP